MQATTQKCARAMQSSTKFSYHVIALAARAHVPKTGAALALAKFPKGVADKIHSHPESNQITIGLSGMCQMSPEAEPMKVEPNMVVIASKGDKHGASDVIEESIVLCFLLLFCGLRALA